MDQGREFINAADIEQQIKTLQEQRKKSALQNDSSKVLMNAADVEMEQEEYSSHVVEDEPYVTARSYNAPKEVYEDLPESQTDPFADTKTKRISEREDEYHSRRFARMLSPERADPFAKEEVESRSYVDVMKENQLDKEQRELLYKMKEKEKEEKGKEKAEDSTPRTRSSRWDQTPVDKKSEWDDADTKGVKKSRWDQTPVAAATPSNSSWDQTPKATDQTPRRKSRWDETPVSIEMSDATPVSGKIVSDTMMASTPEELNVLRWERELDYRNRFLSDEELDSMLPKEGYSILEMPASYVPIRTPSRKLMETPTPLTGDMGFVMQEETKQMLYGALAMEGTQELPFMKPEDHQYFGVLLDGKPDDQMTLDEAKERKILRLLLRIKNGTPQMRKVSLRQITEKARDFGAGPLFNKLLPLLMSPTLEDQERHLLVKVIGRILYKLDELVRPFVHKILVVIEPLLIDEDYYARVEGREIISNLSKAAGLATMISVMRPDIDHVDEYVRNTTARAFAVVASALGIPSVLPFLKAVCKSKKSWQARHTGIKIIQQIAILTGCAILPHLKSMTEIIAAGLTDEQQKVRTITALAVSALAEASAPYGIESFDVVLKPLWKGIRQHRGKTLAAFLKAIGFIIPLMDAEYASYYTKEVFSILVREFQTSDEEMKKIVLKVVKQCASTDGVDGSFLKKEMLEPFFRYFWTRRMALDRRNYRQLIETTIEVSKKVGAPEMLKYLIGDLKDESEGYRKMVVEGIEKIILTTNPNSQSQERVDKGKNSMLFLEERLEKLLIDGMIYAYEEITTDDISVIHGFGVVANALGMRCKPYVNQICSKILWRLNHRSAKIRQQAADLISKLANVMSVCGEEKLMGHLGLILYEYLGEEYPEVLGSILAGLRAIVSVIGMAKMTPPIKDLLPRLTPILRNRHEKVLENCIDLVGKIADRAAESVSAREWMRICFELLDTLKAHKKSIRRTAINTFGFIAKAIGPNDVLSTLLNNLKVQERQNRLCTTIAIAIVAETCGPFTVVPALMNEYRVPDMNVQNGVLKSFSFLFEYIGEMSKDYIYAITPLIEDALMDRDLIHRQTACSAVKHAAINVYGAGCEDALTHLLNFVWPNIFESSAHTINTVIEAVEGLRWGLGVAVMLHYIIQGLFHPARKVREVYWKLYNYVYISGQDALIPYYPRVEGYERKELEIFI